MEIKTKINKGPNEIQKICTTEKTIKKKKRKKREHADLEKIFASNVTEKGLADLQYKK